MNRAAALSLVLVLGALRPGALRADEEAPSVETVVQAFWSAPDGEAAAEAGKDLLALDLPVAELERALAAGRAYAADVPKGWLQRKHRCSDGVERNVLLYVPESYTPGKRYRLTLDLHGGVSRPRILTFDELEQMKFFWGQHAEESGYLLAIPTGQEGAVWWDAVGVDNVLGVIEDVKREYDVDENLVVATGFSDGGSGSFYLALTHPTPFAAFVPLNGHLGVTQAGGLQTHLLPLLNKPLYVVNTKNDSLYPSASVKPIVDELEKLGADLVWRDIPEYGHDPSYLPQERPAIWTWLREQRREPHPKTVVWQGTEDAPARVHWLEVTDVDAVGETVADEVFPDPNPKIARGRVLLGVTVDPAFAGPGVKIDTVNDDSPASAAGVEPGDVLVAVDGNDLGGLPDLRAALGAKHFGDAFRLRLRRGDETLDVEGTFPVVEPEPVFRRTKPWGAVRARYADNVFDVTTRGIGSFDLLLSSAMVDFGKPVKVVVDGEVLHDALVEGDPAVLVRQAIRDRDRTMLYRARLAFTVR